MMSAPMSEMTSGLVEQIEDALNKCRVIIKFHCKPEKCCSFSFDQPPFSASDAHNAAVEVLEAISAARAPLPAPPAKDTI